MTARLLTTTQVAERLQCSRKFVLDELHRGNLVGALIGRSWRIEPAALDTYVAAHLNVRPIKTRRSA